ncbi:MAG TPA: gliding motility-associated C-terminal domain-containing protein, partial [Bacteroidales bacterium]|nr:gliding motility-associated C-terminal domain-containing protein [Bacteroidales bacterium]
VTDAAGNSSTCEATVTVHYSVDPNPAVTPDNTVICNGGTINLALTSQIPSTTWTWHVNSPAGITGTSDDNSGQFTTINQTIFNSAPVAQQLTYNITPRVYGACDLEQITASVRVNPTPVIEANSADTILCYGDATVINIHNMNPHVKGKWVYDLQVEAEPGISGFSASSRQTSPTDLTEILFNTDTNDRKVVYSFTPRIILPDGSQECEGETVTVTLTVHPQITYYSELSDYNGYNISCFGYHNGSIRLTPTVDLAPFTYTWRGPNGYSATNNTGYVSDLYAGDYIITITDRRGCHVTDTITLTEPDKFSMTYELSESNDLLFNINCHGASTGWAAINPVNNVGAVNYVWSDYATRDSLRTNMKAGIYSLTIIDANSCRADSTIELTEPPALELAFDVKHAYCPDMPDGEIALTVTGGSPLGGHTFHWSNGETTQDLAGILPGLHTVSVTDYNGCTVLGSILVRPKNEICLIIPEAFSPNGDGYNDTWEIGNIELYPNMEIKIFNRWGQKLWESESGYPHPWDGRSNGSRLPIDSYHYVIDINNGSKPIIGTITIVYSLNDH